MVSLVTVPYLPISKWFAIFKTDAHSLDPKEIRVTRRLPKFQTMSQKLMEERLNFSLPELGSVVVLCSIYLSLVLYVVFPAFSLSLYSLFRTIRMFFQEPKPLYCRASFVHAIYFVYFRLTQTQIKIAVVSIIWDPDETSYSSDVFQ